MSSGLRLGAVSRLVTLGTVLDAPAFRWRAVADRPPRGPDVAGRLDAGQTGDRVAPLGLAAGRRVAVAPVEPAEGSEGERVPSAGWDPYIVWITRVRDPRHAHAAR